MPTTLVGAGAHPTQPAAVWDPAPSPTREIHKRQYQWALAFVYVYGQHDSIES